MKIIILGADKIGSTLAEYLVTDGNNDITVVDNQHVRLQYLQEKFDLRTVLGQSAYPQTLIDAGVEDADMLIAVTSSDEINILACQIAYRLFNTPRRIARIHSVDYLNNMDFLDFLTKNVLPTENIIMPEKLVTEHIRKLIDYPGALKVANFANGNLYLISMIAYYGGALIGDEIADITHHLPYVNMKIMALYRKGTLIRLYDSTIIEAGDEIIFITEPSNIKPLMNEFQRPEKPYKKIVIVGGGNIGTALAKELEQKYRVTLIEQSEARANHVVEQLNDTLVLQGEASDLDLLVEDPIDLFIAVTNDDEANIMSALLAKKVGAQKTIALIQRNAYLDLVQGGPIDIAISPSRRPFRRYSIKCVKVTFLVFIHCPEIKRKLLRSLCMVMKKTLMLLVKPFIRLSCQKGLLSVQ